MLLAFGPGTTILGLLVRLVTRRPGQRFADVPGHVALLFSTETGYFIRVEALGNGVVSRPVVGPEPHEWAVRVHLPNEDAADWFAFEQVGERYDWFGILLNALCLLCPRVFVRFAKCYNPPDVWTCSRLAAAVLFAGRGGMVRTDAPPTPNDVLEFVAR